MRLCTKATLRMCPSKILLSFLAHFSRPLREIFVNKVVRQQLKLAEKALFVTKDKWEVFMNQNLVFTSNATLDYDCLPAALGYSSFV